MASHVGSNLQVTQDFFAGLAIWLSEPELSWNGWKHDVVLYVFASHYSANKANNYVEMLAFAFLPTSQLCLVAFTVHNICWLIYTTFFHPLAKFPGPLMGRVSRWWYVYLIIRGNQGEHLRRLHLQHGPIVRIAPNEVSIADPSAIDKIYDLKGKFLKTKFYKAFDSDGGEFPNRFTALDENYHTKLSKKLGNPFSVRNIQSQAAQIIDVSDAFISQMERYADSGEVFDMAEWLQRYASSVLEKVFFSRDLQHMNPDYDMRETLRMKTTIISMLSVLAVVPCYARFAFVVVAQVIPSIRVGFLAFRGVFREAQETVKRRHGAGINLKNPNPDLLDRILRKGVSDGDQRRLHINEVFREAWGALMVGSDTTGTALTVIFDLLVRHPDIFRQVRAEVDAAIADSTISWSAGIGPREMQRLEWLNACVKEGMRLCPSIGMILPRSVPSEGATMCGERFVGGTHVGVSAAVVHYNQIVFGEDASEFKPSRWLNISAEHRREMEKSNFSFGRGKRRCGGEALAMAEIYNLITRLVEVFDFRAVYTQKVHHDYFFYRPADVWMKVQRRRR